MSVVLPLLVVMYDSFDGSQPVILLSGDDRDFLAARPTAVG
jgi:hypothetical protein